MASKRDSINLVIFAEHSVISVKTEEQSRAAREAKERSKDDSD